MNLDNEIDWEKLVEWAEADTTYLLHLVVNSHKMVIEVQDKYSGEIWQSEYTSERIEQLTDQAKNKKKYVVFINMLRIALERTKQTLKVSVLSYRQLSLRFGRTPEQLRNITPQQASKRFLILSYIGEFQKMQFPLPPERLKLTIRRLAQQNHLLRQGQENSLPSQIGLLKYENQSLKAKLKQNSRLDNSTFLQPKIDEIYRSMSEKESTIESLKLKISNVQKQKDESDRRSRENDEKIKQYQKILKDKENYNERKTNVEMYEQKLDILIKQMKQLGQELLFAKEKQRKSDIKIATLQKELENMINKQSTNTRKYKDSRRESSPQQKNGERQHSIKSGKSNNSIKSSNSKGKNITSSRNINKNTYNYTYNQNSKINKSNKKSSIYDSDTESSRMRKLNNGRSSPYRQTTSTINNKKPSKQTERSRSKSRERVISPKPSNIIQSQMFTYAQQYQSDDSQERLERLEKKGQYLKNRKEKNGKQSKTSSRVVTSTKQGTKIQNRMQVLQQMIRKAAQSVKKKN